MKNKKIADVSIGVLSALIIIITVMKMYFRDNGYLEMLSFVIEAALVGSIADWFAITALFEKPFLVGNIPIIASNTAIIPKNRESIVNAVAYVVQNELLSEKVLRDKIEQLNIMDSIVSFVDKNISTRRDEFVDKAIQYFIERINSVDTLEFSGFLESQLKQKIETIDLSIPLYKAISSGIESDEFKKIFNIIVDSLIDYINRETTKEQLEKIAEDILKKETDGSVVSKFMGILKSINAINTSDIAIALVEQSNKLLSNLKNEDDALRCSLMDKIRHLSEKIYTDNEVMSGIERYKLETLKEISIQQDLNKLLKELIKRINEKELLNTEQRVSITRCIKTILEKCWNTFKNNSDYKKRIEQWFKKFAFEKIESNYDTIGYIVKQVLNSMDDQALNQFIKQKAGNELHGIRINGCIVGALFGGAVFVLTHLIYDFVLPNVFNIQF
jgi:uncharacterized membrane-anchored protein YjiN (DUF445 family)